jgi:hypothetical protein
MDDYEFVTPTIQDEDTDVLPHDIKTLTSIFQDAVAWTLLFVFVCSDVIETVVEYRVDYHGANIHLLWLFSSFTSVLLLLLCAYALWLWRSKAISSEMLKSSHELSDVVTILVFVLWLLFVYLNVNKGDSSLSVRLVENVLACSFLYSWYFLMYRKIRSKRLQRPVAPSKLSTALRVASNLLSVITMVLLIFDAALWIILGIYGPIQVHETEVNPVVYVLWILDAALLLEFVRFIWRCVAYPTSYHLPPPQVARTEENMLCELFVLLGLFIVIVLYYLSTNMTVYLRQVIFDPQSKQFIDTTGFQAIIDSALLVFLIVIIFMHVCCVSRKVLLPVSSFITRMKADVLPVFSVIIWYILAYFGALFCTIIAVTYGDLNWALLFINVTGYLLILVWSLFSFSLTSVFVRNPIFLSRLSAAMWVVFGMACFFLFLAGVPIVFQVSYTAIQDWATLSLGMCEVILLIQQLHLIAEVKSYLNR